MNNNLLGTYFAGAFKAAIASCLINGKISEQQIDFVKEIVSKYRESEIDHSFLNPEEKEEAKRNWKLWLDETANGVKDEFRTLGKLE